MNTIHQNFGIYGNALSGMMAKMQEGSLEVSNVDLAQSTLEQKKMQSSIEANVQTIQTADSMLQTLLDIQA